MPPKRQTKKVALQQKSRSIMPNTTTVRAKRGLRANPTKKLKQDEHQQEEQQKQQILKQELKKKQKLRKRQIQQLQQLDQGQDDASNGDSQQGSQSDDDSDEDLDNDSGDDGSDDQQQSSEISSLAPENYAVRHMQFRQRRGTKMNYLMNRKKQEQEDSFWQNQGQDYFGVGENGQGDIDDEEDGEYEQSSSGRDQFDSDFDQTESEHSDDEQKKIEDIEEADDGKIKEKRRQQELMRKIRAPAPPVKQKVTTASKTNATSKNEGSGSVSNKKAAAQAPQIEATNRYIHQVCSQQQLLGQAAHTEYINWLSLQKLISIQSDKKEYVKKQHRIEGSKIIYRDRITPEGKRDLSYQLVDVKMQQIGDLTKAWLRQK